MGYEERLIKSTCRGCDTVWLWRRGPADKPFRRWSCKKCGGANVVAPLPDWPEVPRSLYIGADNARLLKLFPVPPERANERWARPYGIRSVLYQASGSLGGCRYTCSPRGAVYDEAVYFDRCLDPNDPSYDPEP